MLFLVVLNVGLAGTTGFSDHQLFQPPIPVREFAASSIHASPAVHFLFKTFRLLRLTFSNPHIVFTCTFPNQARNKFSNSTNASFHLVHSPIAGLLTFNAAAQRFK